MLNLFPNESVQTIIAPLVLNVTEQLLKAEFSNSAQSEDMHNLLL